MTDLPNTTESLSVVVTGASNAAGNGAIRAFVRRGVPVFGIGDEGSLGVTKIQNAGGIACDADVRRPESVASIIRMAKANVLVHLAPQSLNNVPQTSLDWDYPNEILGQTQGIIDVAKANGIERLVFGSFAFLYGDQHGKTVDETAHLSHDKQFASAIKAEQVATDSGIPTAIVRSGFVYGGASEELFALGQRMRYGKPVLNGDGMAPYIHGDDLGEAIATLVEQGVPEKAGAEIFNVANPDSIKADDFATALSEALGQGEPNLGLGVPEFFAPIVPQTPQMGYINNSMQLDTSKIRSLGWEPSHTLVSGINHSMMIWRALERV